MRLERSILLLILNHDSVIVQLFFSSENALSIVTPIVFAW